MSTCISMHGEYSNHTPDTEGNFTCTRCGWLDEDTLISQARRAQRMEETLRDIADHGLRADLNPTVPNVRDAGNYGWWMNYLGRIDGTLRERARAALDESEAP